MSRFKLGLQLYSIRDYMEKDMDAALKSVADMGYECVEFAGYFDHSAEEVKAMCEKYGLEPISVHQRYPVFLDDTENSVGYLKTLGVKYCAIPWISPEDWENNYDSIVADIKKVGPLLKENGIRLMYHNHDFEFRIKRGDKYLLDALYADVDSDVLIPELDVCWVNYGGADPVEYVKKYGASEKILHMKDFTCTKRQAGSVYALIDDKGTAQGGDKKADGFEFRAVGHGCQDVKAIMKAAEDTEIDYVIVEQDSHTTNTSIEDARLSIEYLRSIGY